MRFYASSFSTYHCLYHPVYRLRSHKIRLIELEKRLLSFSQDGTQDDRHFVHFESRLLKIDYHLSGSFIQQSESFVKHLRTIVTHFSGFFDHLLQFLARRSTELAQHRLRTRQRRNYQTLCHWLPDMFGIKVVHRWISTGRVLKHRIIVLVLYTTICLDIEAGHNQRWLRTVVW